MSLKLPKMTVLARHSRGHPAGWSVCHVPARGLRPGGSTNLSDQFPWGLWIGFDVLCGVGLAAGGFTLVAIVHIFNLERYKPYCARDPDGGFWVIAWW